jgi:hypothetical protein
VWWWLFQRFEQRIKRWIGEHMNLVDDIELDAGLTGSKADFLTQITDFVDPTIAGRINLDHIQETSFVHGLTNAALAARLIISLTHTVDGFGQQPRRCGFARATRAGEKVGVCYALRRQCILQGSGHVVLADDLFKGA